jgi:hypothetical protein
VVGLRLKAQHAIASYELCICLVCVDIQAVDFAPACWPDEGGTLRFFRPACNTF